MQDFLHLWNADKKGKEEEMINTFRSAILQTTVNIESNTNWEILRNLLNKKETVYVNTHTDRQTEDK